MYTTVLSLLAFGAGLLLRTGFQRNETNLTLYFFMIFFFAIGGLILASGLLSGVSAMISRLSFCRRLKRIAESNGYTYTAVRHPIVPFFCSKTGEDIILTRRERVVRLKLFPGFTSRWFLHLQTDGTVFFFKKMGMVGGNIKGGALGVPVSGGNGRVLSRNVIKFKKKADLSFTKDIGECIVIISPKCIDMTCVSGNTCQVVGSGQPFGKCRLYFQKDFLNYFERSLTK